jgi:hypothetical protein
MNGFALRRAVLFAADCMLLLVSEGNMLVPCKASNSLLD